MVYGHQQTFTFRVQAVKKITYLGSLTSEFVVGLLSHAYACLMLSKLRSEFAYVLGS